MLNEQKIRALYSEHIGTIKAERAAGTVDAPFVLLEIEAVDDVVHTYATLGASEGPLKHELVLDALEPFAPYGDAVDTVARAAPALGPGVVIPRAIPGTPFTALLCLPVGAGGSFALGKAAAPSHALRLAPLTAAEQALAERAPDRVLDVLRAAFALHADRYRACLVDLPSPPPSARTDVALQRRRARAALLSLQADVMRKHGPRKRGSETTIKRRPHTMRLRVGSHSALIYHLPEFIHEALTPYVRHPAPVVYFFAEFVYVTLATHPDAVRMIERAADPRNLPGRTAGDMGHAAAAASHKVTAALAVAIARCHAADSDSTLLARGLGAVQDALSTFDPTDEIPVENHVWATVLPAMYEGLDELKAPALRGLPRVFRRVAQNEAMLEYEPDPRPPLMRLEEIAARIATALVIAYAAGLRGQLPG